MRSGALEGDFTEATAREELEALATIPAGPRIAVLPVSKFGGLDQVDHDSLGLTHRLTHDLTRFHNLHVVSTEGALGPQVGGLSLSKLREQSGIGYLLATRVSRHDGTLRVEARLSDAKDMGVLWSQIYEEPFTNDTLDTVFQDISAKVAAVVGAPQGVIGRSESRKLRGPLSDEVAMYQCTLRFYEYTAQKSAKSHLEQRRCLENVTTALPDQSRPWAMLSWVYGDEVRYGFNAAPGRNSKELALEAAKRALELAPLDSFSHQYMAEALLLNRQDKLAERHWQRALVLNPNDTEILASLAWHSAFHGDWDLAEKFALKAMTLNPFHPNWYRVVPYMVHMRRGEYEKALEQVEARRAPFAPLSQLGRLVARVKLGRLEEAKNLLAELDTKYPGFSQDIPGEFAKLHLPADFAEFVDQTISEIR